MRQPREREVPCTRQMKCYCGYVTQVSTNHRDVEVTLWKHQTKAHGAAVRKQL